MIQAIKLKNRDIYLDKLKAFQDKDVVKVVTGIRRCGKSSLLKLMANYLRDEGIDENQIVEINFESYEFSKFTPDDLYSYVKEHTDRDKRCYLFFDEIQRIRGWENAVNAFRVDFDSDIYITGSNAYLLSSEYSTYLAGRYVEIKMLPLSFKEFLYFCDLELKKDKSILGDYKYRLYDGDDKSYEVSDVFELYMRFGGMPILKECGFNQEKAFNLIDGIYSSIIFRDILDRENFRGQKNIADPILLKKIILFLADNIGSSISASNASNVLHNEGLITTKPSPHTVQSYIEALLESYIFYEIKRFDIKGKEYLRTLGKYYIADIGIRNYLLGVTGRDRGHLLENIVYLELLRRGYDVAIGKIGTLEIDFVASKQDERLYIQVTESMIEESVRERELEPFFKVKDNYEKLVLSLNPSIEKQFDGIKNINVLEWLLDI